jgi:hypothetical protein
MSPDDELPMSPESVPSSLRPLMPLLRGWARVNPSIRRLWVYESARRSGARTLHVAISLDRRFGALDDFLRQRHSWESELARLTRRTIHLELAHPAVTPVVGEPVSIPVTMVYHREGISCGDE